MANLFYAFTIAAIASLAFDFWLVGVVVFGMLVYVDVGLRWALRKER